MLRVCGTGSRPGEHTGHTRHSRKGKTLSCQLVQGIESEREVAQSRDRETGEYLRTGNKDAVGC